MIDARPKPEETEPAIKPAPKLLHVAPGGEIPDGYRQLNRHEKRQLVSAMKRKKRQIKRASQRQLKKLSLAKKIPALGAKIEEISHDI